MSAQFVVLTPYLVPELPGRKPVNLGDGLILRAIERLIGPFDSGQMFTPRRVPSDDEYDALRSAKGIILAGANQLHDHYTVWPRLTAERILRDRLRLIPFGIGLDGIAKRNQFLSEDTKSIIRAIHHHIEYSSWRCPRTTAILDGEFPDLRGRFLMTGCPVIYDRPLLEKAVFSSADRRIAVTITDRGDFWERETGILDTVAHEFPSSRRFLVIHQDHRPETMRNKMLSAIPGISGFLNAVFRLRKLARKLGYAVVVPNSADTAMAFYRDVDMHIGSRLHAHLYFLSQNKRSFLVAVDGRSRGFAEFLRFPICDPHKIEEHLSFDFEVVRKAAQESFKTMQMFVETLER